MNDYSGYGEIKVGDKILPFKFGLNAHKLFCTYRDCELHELGEKLKDVFSIVELAYFAHVSNERINGRQTDVTLDWFYEAVGDTPGCMEEFHKLMLASKMWGVSVAELTDKKKES